jgi:hypothetical protein
MIRITYTGLLAPLSVLLTTLLLPVQPSLAQVMLSPTAVIGTDLGQFSDVAPLTNMINQSGLKSPFVSGSTDFDTYFARGLEISGDANGTNNWQSDFQFDLPLTGYVDFDLGASYSVSKMAIYNISLENITLRMSEELAELTNAPIAGAFRLTNHVHFPFSYPPDVIQFDAPVQGRYLRIDISSAYRFSISDTFAYAIIGEVVLSVAVGNRPELAIVKTSTGDVLVMFGGSLETTDLLGAVFTNAAGNPQTSLTIPQGSLATQQFFRARSD